MISKVHYKYIIINWHHHSSLQCSDTVGWATGRGIQHENSWVLVCARSWYDLRFACLIAPAVTTTSIILSSNKIQNGDILVQANQGLPGKMAFKHERQHWHNS